MQKRQEEQGNYRGGREIYFIKPTGTYLQNITTINTIINYGRWNISEENLLKDIFSFNEPKFRIEYMVVEGIGEVRKVVLDLIPLIIEHGDTQLMKKLYGYIDIGEYSQYKTEIERMVSVRDN